jgi:hypothetical protein
VGFRKSGKISPEQLLALTGKVPTEMKETIASSPAAMQFVRDAKDMNLSEEEWQKLNKQLKRLRR